tara:strand:+ start:1739 stop:1954 length:216 start_codon:yes stop_codon:yes gene_type:complete
MNIDQWIMDANKGDKMIYHKGYMASDICDPVIKLLNRKINEYCQQKLITVTQRMIKRGHLKSVYEYIVFKL